MVKNTKFGNSCIGFFLTRKLTIYKMTSVRKSDTFQNLLENITLLPAEKFGNIKNNLTLGLKYILWKNKNF